MFLITPTVESDFPKAFAKAEREKPWITRKGDNVCRVVPRKLRDGSREHGKYVVRFVQWGSKVWSDCVNVLTGERCPGHRFDGCCYHIAATIKHEQRIQSRKAA